MFAATGRQKFGKWDKRRCSHLSAKFFSSNRGLPLTILEEILKGRADKALEAGVSIAGGHSIEDNAPKYRNGSNRLSGPS
ncbi:MAG: hypothetical protein SCK28_06665 [Bacillota bacterium]|nr:hypothetical protein [Bacillota bacterium]